MPAGDPQGQDGRKQQCRCCSRGSFDGGVGWEQALSLAKDYHDPLPVPSYDRYGAGFSPEQYWRGPVWINIKWLLMHGLRRYGFAEYAQQLRRAIVGLCQEEGFYEYFDPLSGRGHGSDLFCWTAALLIDVLMEKR
jgi:glycogen debranching enzyme